CVRVLTGLTSIHLSTPFARSGSIVGYVWVGATACITSSAWTDVAPSCGTPCILVFFFSSRRRHTRLQGDWSSDVCSSDLIAGIGFVAGIRCMVSANDSGIDAGALQPYGLDKTLRVQELALENKLPYVQLVESAGANLLRYRVEDFIRGGNIFRNLARLSAAGLPVVTVTHGSSTAGGAYQTGLSDYIVMVRGRTRAFLAGPPLLKAATGEIATEEELGGAEMHTQVSGLGDYL